MHDRYCMSSASHLLCSPTHGHLRNLELHTPPSPAASATTAFASDNSSLCHSAQSPKKTSIPIGGSQGDGLELKYRRQRHTRKRPRHYHLHCAVSSDESPVASTSRNASTQQPHSPGMYKTRPSENHAKSNQSVECAPAACRSSFRLRHGRLPRKSLRVRTMSSVWHLQLAAAVLAGTQYFKMRATLLIQVSLRRSGSNISRVNKEPECRMWPPCLCKTPFGARPGLLL